MCTPLECGQVKQREVQCMDAQRGMHVDASLCARRASPPTPPECAGCLFEPCAPGSGTCTQRLLCPLCWQDVKGPCVPNLELKRCETTRTTACPEPNRCDERDRPPDRSGGVCPCDYEVKDSACVDRASGSEVACGKEGVMRRQYRCPFPKACGEPEKSFEDLPCQGAPCH